jgi:hypothetical protein
MTPEVQIELIKAAQIVIPMIITFFSGLFLPQPKAKK